MPRPYALLSPRKNIHRLEELIALPGISGHEDAVIAYMRQQFALQADDVSVDWLGNVIARVGPAQGQPRIMVFAHMEELGLSSVVYADQRSRPCAGAPGFRMTV